VEAWRQDYNEFRPHSSLDQQTPSEFVLGWQQIRAAPKVESLTLSKLSSNWEGVNVDSFHMLWCLR
jgi:Integrase core domain